MPETIITINDENRALAAMSLCESFALYKKFKNLKRNGNWNIEKLWFIKQNYHSYSHASKASRTFKTHQTFIDFNWIESNFRIRTITRAEFISQRAVDDGMPVGLRRIPCIPLRGQCHV